MKLFAWILAIFVFLLASTPWKSWDEGIQYLQANDVKSSYEKISLAAPQLPSDSLARHHAQRFFWPYVIGSIAQFTGLKMESVYRSTLLVFYGFLLLGLIYGLQSLSMPADIWRWPVILLCLNPYFFRYYWIVPGMLADVAFMCFSLWLAAFSIRKKSLPMLLCFVGALVSRQTAVFLLPALFLWIWWSKASYKMFFLQGVALLFTFSLSYLWINQMVNPFSDSGTNVGILLSLWSYFEGGQASFLAILELLARVVVPLIVPLAIFIRFSLGKWPSKITIFLLLGVMGVVAQPILGGPIITGKNAGRLAALALPWLVLAVGSLQIPFPRLGIKSKLLLGFFALGSLHHLFSQPALPNQIIFVIVHVISAFLILLMIYDLREKAKLSEF
jgi:hypothetical protein